MAATIRKWVSGLCRRGLAVRDPPRLTDHAAQYRHASRFPVWIAGYNLRPRRRRKHGTISGLPAQLRLGHAGLIASSRARVRKMVEILREKAQSDPDWLVVSRPRGSGTQSINVMSAETLVLSGAGQFRDRSVRSLQRGGPHRERRGEKHWTRSSKNLPCLEGHRQEPVPQDGYAGLRPGSDRGASAAWQ